ncbi:unnamed protein product [Timema podura]|uniref:Uncharacterized protein n=1 Tax=Timema podura TaxID=61482 RepID=A0ABN7NT75_TIMPD|nr:unnamed protein product [Timema podura]
MRPTRSGGIAMGAGVGGVKIELHSPVKTRSARHSAHSACSQECTPSSRQNKECKTLRQLCLSSRMNPSPRQYKECKTLRPLCLCQECAPSSQVRVMNSTNSDCGHRMNSILPSIQGVQDTPPTLPMASNELHPPKLQYQHFHVRCAEQSLCMIGQMGIVRENISLSKTLIGQVSTFPCEVCRAESNMIGQMGTVGEKISLSRTLIGQVINISM